MTTVDPANKEKISDEKIQEGEVKSENGTVEDLTQQSTPLDIASEIARIEQELEELNNEAAAEEAAANSKEEDKEADSATLIQLSAAEEEAVNNYSTLLLTQVSSQQMTLSGANLKAIMDVFIAELPNCVNRELVDRAAKEFCLSLNTKLNRKRLVQALFQVPRTRLDLLAFYARLVAILHNLMPEIATELAALLQNEFRFHVRKKDQINIESKIRVVRFIGELVKFGMFGKTEALNCLKTLLADLRHHNIEMLCNLLDVCGRFLYRSADSFMKLKLMLVCEN